MKGLVNVRALFISLALALIIAFAVLPSNVTAMECDPCHYESLHYVLDPEEIDY